MLKYTFKEHQLTTLTTLLSITVCNYMQVHTVLTFVNSYFRCLIFDLLLLHKPIPSVIIVIYDKH